MADIVDNQEQSQVQTPDPQKAELDQMMAISLNGGLPPETNTAPQEAAQSAVVENPAVVTPNVFDTFKEKYGYEKPEDVLADIEQYRALKAAPAATPEIKFENEESERLFKAITSGKRNEVFQILEKQERIERLIGLEVNKDTAADIVKYGMQLKYKDLTPEEINYKFNKTFAIPNKPIQAVEEDDTDYQTRISAWQDIVTDKQMELMIEAKLAKPDLEASKSKLVIPEIEQTADEDYLQYKKMLEERPRLDAELKEAYKALTPKQLEIKSNFKDEPNKIAFDFQFEPDVEGFTMAVDIASDSSKFWQMYVDKDGKPDRVKFLSDIYFARNRERIIQEAMNQAKNATIKSMLPDNSQGGLVRQMPQTQEPSELDKQMRASLAGYGGF